jgi:large subunit ribosomal protein L25
MSKPPVQHHVMQAIAKPAQGKGAARAVRAQGLIPGIIYGKGAEVGQSIAVNGKDLAKALRVGHFFTHTQELNLAGQAVKVLARDIQRHPVSDLPIHIDFIRFDPARIMNVNVVVNIVGADKSPGIKQGGVLQLIESALEVVCRADAIPQEIAVDISALEIGDSIHMSDVKLPAGVKSAVTDRDLTIASVVSTRTSKMEEETTAASVTAEVPASSQKADGKAPAAASAGKGPAKDAAKAPAAKPAAKKK